MVVGSHIGTYYYIRVMDRFGTSYYLFLNETTHLSSGLTKDEVSFGALQDPLQGTLGWTNLSGMMPVFDVLAAIFPGASACFFAICMKDVFQWTKLMVCHGIVATLKGLLALVTTIPDSEGWAQCKQRLGDTNLQRFRDIPSPEENGWAALFGSIFKMEMSMCLSWDFAHPCASMIFCERTAFMCLYGLSLVESVRMLMRSVGYAYCHGWMHQVCHSVVGCCVFTLIGLQSVVMLVSRLHYTIDILMATIIVFLLYTNSALCIACKQWQFFGSGINQRQANSGSESYEEIHERIFEGSEIGKRVVLARLSQSTDHHKYSVKALSLGYGLLETSEDSDESKGTAVLPLGLQEWANDSGCLLVSKSSLHPGGDMWIPRLCCPFSCCGVFGSFHSFESRIEEKLSLPLDCNSDSENEPATTMPPRASLHQGRNSSRDVVAYRALQQHSV